MKKQKKEKQQEVLNSWEAAEFLGLKAVTGYRTIQRLARQGRLKGFLPSHKQGWRFHIDALRNALLLGGSK